jgi:hypothetical protein
VTGVRRRHEPDRALATVLFTDIVDSTRRAAQLGDRAWRELLERHHTLARDELARAMTPSPVELVPPSPQTGSRARSGQLGHHRPQPLRIQPLGQHHRPDHVGEQHRDLLALARRGRAGVGLSGSEPGL